MSKIISEILDEFYDSTHHCYTIMVEYRENILHKGWTSLHYSSKGHADEECYVGMKIREGL